MIRRSQSELLRTKRDAELATRGADVLERLENALMKDLMETEQRIKGLDTSSSAMMEKIMSELSSARRGSVLADVGRMISTEAVQDEVEMGRKKKFGKLVSSMGIKARANREFRWGAPFPYERARRMSDALLAMLIELGNAQADKEFVETELWKTRRRVNALRRIILPDLNARKKLLEEWMDEENREELARRRWVEAAVTA